MGAPHRLHVQTIGRTLVAMATLSTIKNPRERWELIKAHLRIRGVTLTSIAGALGISRAAVGVVGRRRYPRVEAAVAAALGVQPRDLWPERYEADGRPVRQRIGYPEALPTRGPSARVGAPRKSISAAHACNGETEGA